MTTPILCSGCGGRVAVRDGARVLVFRVLRADVDPIPGFLTLHCGRKLRAGGRCEARTAVPLSVRPCDTLLSSQSSMLAFVPGAVVG